MTKEKKQSISILQYFNSLSLRWKMNFIGVLIIIMFSSILFMKILPLLEAGKLEERRGKLKAVVNSVVSLMDFYEKQVRKEAWKEDPSMPKTIEDAKKIVIRNLREMRYDKTEYFFILDGKGTMVMHPLRPEDQGKNMLEEKDPNGNDIFKDMVIDSQRDSDTFVSFIWKSKYSPDIFESQTTYSKYYWPWDWVVSSGVYTQDIIESMEQIRYRSAAYVIITTLIAMGLLVFFIHNYLNVPLRKIVDAITEINKDNLEYRIKPLFLDELGQISNQFNTMVINRKKNEEDKIRIERAHLETLKVLNSSLEQKVVERTAELSETLNKVQELKSQQDGDYFLTTLITNPLMQNRNTHQNIKIDFLIEQKKDFEFKNKKYRIGGDICISGNLNFKGVPYTMFFNGDAMGKSMQGAGGALVIGSVVNSIMARSAANKKVLTNTPEEWLYDSFHEMQRVLESFDGSMFISCIIGLVNDSTGLLHYINAEHPFTILFRDNVASFIEDEIDAHKLGFPLNDLKRISTFQLLKDDVIICGSDGRDDLVLEHSTFDTNRKINEDDTLILKVVENSKGDLEKIFHQLQEIGDLSDDLSFVRIEYLSEPQLIQTVRTNFNQTNGSIEPMIKQLIKDKKYLVALQHLESTGHKNDIMHLYYKILCLNKLHRNSEALEYLEQADEELKNDILALKLLAKIYFDLGDYENSNFYLSQLKTLVPNDSKILGLYDKVQYKLKQFGAA
ncbi:MAG: cache domain-containing protein [Leptospiraceae bacterium]|nr:cache domain-containing protein [Leptospiraceae bacterium]